MAYSFALGNAAHAAAGAEPSARMVSKLTVPVTMQWPRHVHIDIRKLSHIIAKMRQQRQGKQEGTPLHYFTGAAVDVWIAAAAYHPRRLAAVSDCTPVQVPWRFASVGRAVFLVDRHTVTLFSLQDIIPPYSVRVVARVFYFALQVKRLGPWLMTRRRRRGRGPPRGRVS